MTTIMTTHALRLHPGQDLKCTLDALVVDHGWPAVCVLTCVGSLTQVRLRFAGQPEAVGVFGPHEIVGLGGTLSATGGSHLHMTVSDAGGRCLGGHVKEGNLVRTTAEIVLGILPGIQFIRSADPATGCPELAVESLPAPRNAHFSSINHQPFRNP